jgi:hypothetical protein
VRSAFGATLQSTSIGRLSVIAWSFRIASMYLPK